MLKTLTIKQQKVYNYYKKFLNTNGDMPTYSIASKELGISQSVIHTHIKNLERLGYLSKTYNGQIALESKQSHIPILGKIACGKPITVYEEEEGRIEVPHSMVGSGDNGYILVAEGDSMKDLGIIDGDYLVIRYQNDVDDGDIAVVIDRENDDDMATLKQVFKTERGLLCVPKNKVFESFMLHNAEIRGKLVGVIKHF